ncbi:hypothetical protein DCO17_01290 [Polynucleobacter tropicus]|uniref:Uncharacterized protein n=1 Tax=Polynucleobacter tropicus TaxID=1743174 RepID=A0A6M9PUK7_9BURK|nr:glycosyltransferase family 10 [Polynucleobacter tropicus]QKM63981.1 hypothetical protein DCO17_01290 [Polynucleobacter tropicus]
MAIIRLSAIGVTSDYYGSLVPVVCKALGYQVQWVRPKHADILIYGPFGNYNQKSLKWCPKPLRPLASKAIAPIDSWLHQRQYQPIKIFQTGENTRPDYVAADYSISFDLGLSGSHHFRMPYWMEMVDWSSEGVTGNQNPRFGRLLSLERLMQPLGKDFLSRPQKAAIFASHLREPRRTLLEAVKQQIEVVQYGRSFDQTVKNHLESGIIKYDELQKVAFNLCPENGMHPGYYTEKIPEAFMAGCLPITWVDENVKTDFNPNSFINLAPMSHNHFSELQEILHSQKILSAYAEQALILNKPSIEPLKNFIRGIIQEALS